MIEDRNHLSTTAFGADPYPIIPDNQHRAVQTENSGLRFQSAVKPPVSRLFLLKSITQRYYPAQLQITGLRNCCSKTMTANNSEIRRFDCDVSKSILVFIEKQSASQ
jgi:hypothetical protein